MPKLPIPLPILFPPRMEPELLDDIDVAILQYEIQRGIVIPPCPATVH